MGRADYMTARVWAYFSKHPKSTIFLGVMIVSSMLWDFSGTGLGLSVLLLTPMLLFTSIVAPAMVLLALGCSVILLIRRSAPAKARALEAARLCAYWGVLWISLLQGRRLAVSRLENAFAPTIHAIETYKHAHGNYPNTLQGVVVAPRCLGGYSYHAAGAKRGESYCIHCATIAFLRHSYCSDRPHWYEWD